MITFPEADVFIKKVVVLIHANGFYVLETVLVFKGECPQALDIDTGHGVPIVDDAVAA